MSAQFKQYFALFRGWIVRIHRPARESSDLRNVNRKRDCCIFYSTWVKQVCCVSKISSDCGCQSKEIGVGMEVRLLSVDTRGFFLAALRLAIAKPLWADVGTFLIVHFKVLLFLTNGFFFSCKVHSICQSQAPNRTWRCTSIRNVFWFFEWLLLHLSLWSNKINVLFKVHLNPHFVLLKWIYLLFEILLAKKQKKMIRINPRFSVPRRNLKNTAIFVAWPSLRRMGPAAVLMSTQEDWIHVYPILSFPWGWCKTYTKSAQKRLPEVLLAVEAISQI